MSDAIDPRARRLGVELWGLQSVQISIVAQAPPDVPPPTVWHPLDWMWPPAWAIAVPKEVLGLKGWDIEGPITNPVPPPITPLRRMGDTYRWAGTKLVCQTCMIETTASSSRNLEKLAARTTGSSGSRRLAKLAARSRNAVRR